MGGGGGGGGRWYWPFAGISFVGEGGGALSKLTIIWSL